MKWKKLLGWFSFAVAPAGGLLGIALGVSLERGLWRMAPHTAHWAVFIVLLTLVASLGGGVVSGVNNRW